MRVFISGGCKNGKSYYAQRLAKAQSEGLLYYIATMAAVDYEDAERIARHQEERKGWGFITVEAPYDIERILPKCDAGGSFLIDSVTALLANEMFKKDGSVNENAAEKIKYGFSNILANIQNIVIVSDYIYSDAVIYGTLTEDYRMSLAEIDRWIARHCDAVLEAAYTNVIIHKGKEGFNEIFGALS